MTNGMEVSVPEAQYISVQDLTYELAARCARTFRKHLLATERLEIHQTLIRGRGAAEDYGVCATNRAAYVLAGAAVLQNPDTAEPEVTLGKGHLIVIPAGAHWGPQLSVLSDELVLLEVARAVDAQSASKGTVTAQVHAIDPKDVRSYEPAGHVKTRNRCLFVDEYVEIIEGAIERHGGAERHSHRDNEQLLYLLGSVPLLVYYPKGAPHGTGGALPEPLDLLVMYSPPLGEAHDALA